MPGGFPMVGDICNGVNYGAASGGQPWGTQVSGSGTVNTKGSWTQIVAATSYDACLAIISLQLLDSYQDADTTFLVDIGVGSSGNEQARIPNLLYTNLIGGGRGDLQIVVPWKVPAGTRIAARCQGNDPQNTAPFEDYLYVSVTLFDGGFTQSEGLAGFDALGANLTTTNGVQMSIAAGADQYNAWTQIIGATVRDYAGLFACWCLNGQGDNKASFAYNIGVGSSGNEKARLPGLLGTLGNTLGSLASPPFFPLTIPAGTRIAAQINPDDNGYNLSHAAPSVVLYGGYR